MKIDDFSAGGHWNPERVASQEVATGQTLGRNLVIPRDTY